MACRILIVDDHDDAREALACLLAAAGFQIAQAASGTEGVQIALSFRPDVAIVDLGMPIVDGFAVAPALRLPNGERPYLIALTGHAGEKWEHLARDAGFDHFAVKPWNCDDMLALLRSNVACRRLSA